MLPYNSKNLLVFVSRKHSDQSLGWGAKSGLGNPGA